MHIFIANILCCKKSYSTTSWLSFVKLAYHNALVCRQVYRWITSTEPSEKEMLRRFGYARLETPSQAFIHSSHMATDERQIQALQAVRRAINGSDLIADTVIQAMRHQDDQEVGFQRQWTAVALSEEDCSTVSERYTRQNDVWMIIEIPPNRLLSDCSSWFLVKVRHTA